MPRWLRQRQALQAHPELTPEALGRFWGKVSKTESCWLWNGAATSSGYGSYVVRHGSTFRHYSPHRLAYELANGKLDSELWLFHDCGVRRCLNPEHLRPVTRSQSASLAASRPRRAA